MYPERRSAALPFFRKSAIFLFSMLFIPLSAYAADRVQTATLAAPAIIDPIAVSARDVTVLPDVFTSEAVLEAVNGFRVIQDISNVGTGNQSTADRWIFDANDSPATPDLMLTYLGTPNPGSGKTFQIGLNALFQTSVNSSVRIEALNKDSPIGMRIDAGSWNGTVFTQGVVSALGFTLSGPYDRLVGGKVTVRYFDSGNNALSTQVITSAAAAAAYTGHQVTGGNLIAYATIDFVGRPDHTGPTTILALDDIGFAPDPATIVAPVKWRIGDSVWNTTSSNWQPLAGGSPTTYTEGATATFDETATGTSPITITIPEPRTPASVTVNGTKDYVFTGAAGSIQGGGNLIKSGSGSLRIENANTYSGPTLLNEGTLVLANSSALASTNVTLLGGTLVFDSSVATNAFTLAGLSATTSSPTNDIALQNNAGVPAPIALTVTGGSTYSGVLSGPGSLIKGGTGTFTLTQANTYTGDTELQETGALRVTNGGAFGTTGTFLHKSAQIAPGIPTFEISGGINFSKPITVDSTTGRAHISGTAGANTLSSPITVSGDGANSINLSADGGTGNVFTVSGPIGAVNFNNSINLRGGSGGNLSGTVTAPFVVVDLLQTAANVVWTISSSGNTWATTRMSMSANGATGFEQGWAGGKLIVGANDALCVTAPVVWTNAVAGGVIDLAGFNQRVSGLSKGTTLAHNPPNSIPNITNTSATTDSTLTIAGLGQDYTYIGRITDGAARKLNLVFDSDGRYQAFIGPAGHLSYTGNTTVVDGTLSILNPAFASTSTIRIGTLADATPSTRAVLELPTEGTHTVAALFIDGVEKGPGLYDFTDSSLAITGLGKIYVPPTSSYGTWVALYQDQGFTNSLRGDDHDGDGLSNFKEFAFGLNPTSASSLSAVAGGLAANGQFSYTRWANSGLTYKVFTSTTLAGWVEDENPDEILGTPDGLGNQTVTVVLTASPVDGKLFVKVEASE